MAAPVDPGAFTDHTPALADAVDARFAPLFTTLAGHVDTDSLQNGIVSPALLSPITWQSVATTSAIPDGGGTLEFFKDHLGFVRIKRKPYAHAGGGSMATDAVWFTLPAGYRPGVTVYARLGSYTVAASSGNNYNFLYIDTAGVARVGGGHTWFANGVHVPSGLWLAEN